MTAIRASSIDRAEVSKFEAMAAEWWDENGKFRPLHLMNPVRLEYVATQIATEFGRDRRGPAPFAGLRVLDIGCGGGLMAEPMARLGAAVTGADAAEGNIGIARAHAAQHGLDIDYRATTAEALDADGERFDVVMALEIVEHVDGPADFVETCVSLLKPGGLLVMSTLNRTPQSFAAAILGAEWVMRWLPRGTHDWRRFLTPDELAGMIAAAGGQVVDRQGVVFDPLRWRFHASARDLSVNYLIAARRS